MDQPVMIPGHTCYYCDEQLYNEDLALIEAVYPALTQNGPEYYHVDDGRDYIYTPCFLHFDCWEEILGSLAELTEDSPPVTDPMSVFDCDLCKSGVRSWETSGLISHGILRVSPRRPEGVTSFLFDPCLGRPMLLCAACIQALNHEVLPVWVDFSHNGECPEGTHKRCWRIGNCTDGACCCSTENHG